MRFFKVTWLLLLFLAASAVMEGEEEEKDIFNSLDTLAEILTVARTQSAIPIKSEQLIEGAIDGLLMQLDPHSSFYNQDRYKTMKEDQNGTFFGIGIIVGYQNSQLTVVAPVEGTPASKAGIRAGDVIVQIDGTNTENMGVYEAIRLLRGNKGSTVRVGIRRSSLKEPLQLLMKRAEIPTNNVRASFMVDEKTGYVALKDFGESATDELQLALQSLETKGMEQLILDLRGNPGGLLPQAISVASLFIPGKKLVVSTKGRLKNANQEYYSNKRSANKDMPLIVLIDRGSASASEIVAGAIQDHDRGLILGVNSWGKGLVQSVFPLSGGTKGLALTTSRYYTPSGRNIQGSYESLKDYYSPESSERLFFSKSENPPQSQFKTAHGRDVLEVRGITPDVFIAFPEIPDSIQELDFRQAAFFNFTAENLDRFGPIHKSWEADENVLEAFQAYCQQKGLHEDEHDGHRELIRRKLTYQFLYSNGAGESIKWAWQYLMKHDNHIQAALGLFGQAQELLKVYNGETKLRPEYTNELRQYAELKRSQEPVQ